MTATATRPSSSEHVEYARRLHSGGWSPRRIADLLARQHDVRVDAGTVTEWVDPVAAERRRSRQRQRMREQNARRTGGRLGAGPQRSPEFRLARMKSLAAVGVSPENIARVMNFDFPDVPVTRHVVIRALATNQPPPAYRRAERQVSP